MEKLDNYLTDQIGIEELGDRAVIETYDTRPYYFPFHNNRRKSQTIIVNRGVRDILYAHQKATELEYNPLLLLYYNLAQKRYQHVLFFVWAEEIIIQKEIGRIRERRIVIYGRVCKEKITKIRESRSQ